MVSITFTLAADKLRIWQKRAERVAFPVVLLLLSLLSVVGFFIYYTNGLGLAYNDARSHLDIGRRVVEGLKPGLAQLGSVWLPLPHILMVPTIWNDFMWHSGLSGALQSMIAYVATGALIYKILQRLGAGLVSRVVAVALFATNLNIFYLQATAMTELLLIATMTAASYELIKYHQDESILTLVKVSFWVMLSTLIRYDGWFLAFMCLALILIHWVKRRQFTKAQGLFFLYNTLADFGIFFWLLWNLAIFKDPLYFAFGPYSAHTQQAQIEQAGQLLTKGDLRQSMISYGMAMLYNSNTFFVLLSFVGLILLIWDKKQPGSTRLSSTVLLAPLFFNVLALYLGHSVLFVQGINGNSWFNIRYGIMMMPSVAVYVGYLLHKLPKLRSVLIGLIIFVSAFAITSQDAVTVDDGRFGSSQKNVREVSGWLSQNAKDTPGFVLISAASHDAIIFSSGLPMKKFIHEGTGAYWESATTSPDRWARWIVMRTNDESDQTFKLVRQSKALYKYNLIHSYPFADIYELKPEYMDQLQTEPVLKQR